MAESDVVAALALRQHGVFSRTQLLEAGVTPSTIARRLRARRWLRLEVAGVYQLAGTPESFRSRLKAATLRSPGAVASHQSAAILHGIGPLPPDARERLHLTRQGGGRGHQSQWETHRVQALDSADRTSIEGIDLTSVSRTIVDLAGTLGPGRFREVFVRAMSTAGADERLRDALTRVPKRGKRGSGLARRLLAETDGLGQLVTTSELEERLLLLIVNFGLPMPESQFLPPWRAGDGIGRVDYAYPFARLIIEADGRTWHARNSAFEADRRRDQAATAAGWSTLRFTWSQIVDEPADVVATIRAALAIAIAA